MPAAPLPPRPPRSPLTTKAFIESGGKAQSDEVLFLPPIVDAAESSPNAAAECARIIRKYISKDYLGRPSWQYNAIMLMRILTDNPGATFTRNFDQKFVDTARQLLKASRDPSVRQILMETLDDLEHTKMDDENLTLIISMWKKEKEKAWQQGGRAPPPGIPPQTTPMGQPVYNPHSQNYFARSHSNKRLPDAVELSSRLEEARTSAKLLEQVVMNTAPAEMLNSDLIKEFADRCQSASRSIQGYMTSEDPAPDNETMENLIDTNEQLQTALNQHKRAVLNSRKHLGLGQRADSDTPVSVPQSNGSGQDHRDDQTSIAPSREPPVSSLSSPISHNGKGKETDYPSPLGPPPSTMASGSGYNSSKPLPDSPLDDPFADPHHAGSSSHAGPSSNGEFSDNNRLAYEPFHPGFGTTPNLDLKPQGRQRDEVSDDEDLYDAPPKNKEPMYRY
ncbi:hypothetical protein B0T10DRAFT_405861 [Thelonectria olida]|uniref:GAT domain-containing protein n=1 Tax=Thelonectria olida TaxID=1576542 RepID=A0A9P8W343_9HYPO|nr:hypothetical protein B0T10DRAFT_405861 [Thelonectria olida]